MHCTRAEKDNKIKEEKAKITESEKLKIKNKDIYSKMFSIEYLSQG